MFPESLRWRIQLWHGFLLAVVLTGLAFAASRHQAANDLRRVDGELSRRVRALLDTLAPLRRPGGPPPGPAAGRDFRLSPERAALFEPADASGYYYAVWRRDGSVLVLSHSVPKDIAMPPFPGTEAVTQGERTRGLLREAFTFTPPGDCLLAGRSIAAERDAMREYARWLAAISGGVLVLGLAIGWWITSRAIRPVADITTTARRIAQGEMGERIPVREQKSELGRLSATLNETFARLDDSFARQAQFTADAAHELRTPVAIILAQAQRALTRERDVATYQQTLEACVNAARRLNQLTESLLELTTHDAGAMSLKLAGCDLAEAARETATLIQPIADERRITLACEISAAPCRADTGRIAQIILNLLSNALDHTPAGGCVTLRTSAGSGHATVTVIDTGPGIAAEHLPRIFDRFYRADDSRNRRTGGAGLGLAICKAIADAHRGTLEAGSVVGKGSTFTLRIPARTPGDAAPAA